MPRWHQDYGSHTKFGTHKSQLHHLFLSFFSFSQSWRVLILLQALSLSLSPPQALEIHPFESPSLSSSSIFTFHPSHLIFSHLEFTQFSVIPCSFKAMGSSEERVVAVIMVGGPTKGIPDRKAIDLFRKA